MLNTYRDESDNPKWNAQRNLDGRTHYVDDNTLKFHKSRVLQTYITDNGLLFAIIESAAADYENTSRIFRPVIFDVFGNVIERTTLENGYKTSKQAATAMWDTLNDIDANQVTVNAINSQIKHMQRDIEEYQQTIKVLSHGIIAPDLTED